MKKKLICLSTLVIVFSLGVMTSYLWQGHQAKSNVMGSKKPEIKYWVAPMDPNYRRGKPGKSPMGMDLIPVYVDGGDAPQGGIKISPVVENNLGVKVANVEARDLSRIIDTVGYVTVDENNIDHIHSYTDGWIKSLNIKATGEQVKKGQLLLKLYSPTLNNAQEELLLAIKNKNQSLIRAGEKKLRTLGLTSQQIKELKQRMKIKEQVEIYATRSGIVSQLNIREGKYIKPAFDLMTIEDLSYIWVIAEVFERQASWVKVGQEAIATLSYLPGKTWQGKVDYVYPELDSKTHTLRVRLVFPNVDLTMKPNMYANVKILSQVVQNTLAIPRAALIRTGDSDRVIQSLGNGRYKSQSIQIGIESGDYYQVIAGLKASDKVVTSAQFLIDSESNLKAGLSRMGSDAVTNDMQTKQETIGMGVIQSVDISNREITLEHQPIPALEMPAMKMTLKVAKDVDLHSLKSGDEIHFVIVKQDEQSYLVIKIHVMQTANKDNHDKAHH